MWVRGQTSLKQRPQLQPRHPPPWPSWPAHRLFFQRGMPLLGLRGGGWRRGREGIGGGGRAPRVDLDPKVEIHPSWPFLALKA